MDRVVTLQRERRVCVFPDGGLSVTDRWHVRISLGARRKEPLALVRATLLDAYGIAREIVHSNDLAQEPWLPHVLPPVVRIAHMNAEDPQGEPAIAAPVRPAARRRRSASASSGAAERDHRVAGLTLLHGARQSA